MKPIKKIALVLVIVFVAIQFIQPAHNKSWPVLPTDLIKLYAVPTNVQSILQNACYDCHSNNTIYPWLAHIQPKEWLMKSNIDSGKAILNFCEFGCYSSRRQISKLKGIANQIKDDEMPLSSYKAMHRKANLTKEEKSLIMDWMNKTADSLSAIN